MSNKHQLIKEKVQIILNYPELWTQIHSSWRRLLYPYLPRKKRHDLKKKFVSHEEADWWADKNVTQKMRSYRCGICPFFHLTSENRRDKSF